MGHCFVPECNHQCERDSCVFYRFPKDPVQKKRWITAIRRADREPGSGARVCSCHFRGGKEQGPEVFAWNKDKIFDTPGYKPKRKKPKVSEAEVCSINELRESFASNEDQDKPAETTSPFQTENVILRAQLDSALRENQELKEQVKYSSTTYTASNLSDNVIRMETGLPNKELFKIVVEYLARFKADVNYYYGWNVDKIPFSDQIFITLMKMRQNYTNLHLANLFNCSTATIANIITTYLHVLHQLFFKDCIEAAVPSRQKNKTSLPGSFSLFGNCRMVIDCTDIEIATPGLMSDQKLTYSTYRSMNSFKTIVGVAPNAVVTYVSKLFPGSVSDKAIVQKSGILNHFVAGDLILADKGFLINDVVPNGVDVNIPPFLNNGKFTESEVKLTKGIAKCRIHVERANARLKDYKILSFIHPYLRIYADKIFQLCAALVNLQNPLIKEINRSIDFD